MHIKQIKVQRNEGALYRKLEKPPSRHFNLHPSRLRVRTDLLLASMEMAVAMQTEDFPYLPSGLAEGMACVSIYLYNRI